MVSTPINFDIVKNKIDESGLKHVGKASIRELVKLVNQIETATGEKFIRMEMGVPGLPPSKIGVDAEIESLKRGVAAIYPNIEGIDELKYEAKTLCEAFFRYRRQRKWMYSDSWFNAGQFRCIYDVEPYVSVERPYFIY